MSAFDQVLPGLYIGSYETASDLEALRSNSITHILTVASDLPPRFEHHFTYKIVQALDMDTQDLSKSFASCFEFIESSINSGGRVLVHCLYGISRSSTIIISYLMAKLRLKFAEALSLLQSCHSQADPNLGFVRQLMKLESVLFGTELPYLCKNCRSELFSKADLIEHSSVPSKNFNKGRTNGTESCRSLFISKMDWMGECTGKSGKIECNYCLNKLGEYNWAGRQCSCGEYVAPAFQIHLSSVDSHIKFNARVSRPKNLS